jgi:hypothetical protein
MRARLTFVFLLLVALAFPALAQDRRGGPSLDRVLPQIARSVPGRFSDAEGPFISADGRATYHIKWMTPDGRIIWFTVDARSGQVMGGAPRFRNHDYSDRNSDRGDRRNNLSGDRGGDRDGGHDWNRGGRDWDQGGDRGRDGGHEWNGGRRDNDRGGRDNDRGGRDRRDDRGGRDRRQGG